ncbi:hypothetical protein PCO31110_02912 [Pandoraea communis]|uniref:Uncharacterized protein n=1 Tax=Pandoraea communis TaxID=2508297 RepID=A0A5E4VWF7_9BURK|nr:hypothetical protein [Pandoraea communis]VVE15846.1 hypothetical protein PCO31110_02912 [Pandoraea communis]
MHKAVIEGQRQDITDLYNARMKMAQASASMSVGECGRTVPVQETTMKAAQSEMAVAKAGRDKALWELEAGDTPVSSTQGTNTLPLPGSFKGSGSGSETPGTATCRATNPGNIRYSGFARSAGAIGQDSSGFAVFPDAAIDTEAMQALLRSYNGCGLNTVGGVVERWAPPSENGTSSCAKSVAKRLGVRADGTVHSRAIDLTVDTEEVLVAVLRDEQQAVRFGFLRSGSSDR